MAITIVRSEMLYCPKCGSTYEEGTQRFCTNDGGRLLPSVSANKTTSNSKGVFSNILGKTTSKVENDEKLSPTPRIASTQTSIAEKPTFQTNFSSKVFKSEFTQKKQDEKTVPIVKPVVRLIKPNEVHSGTAEIGDRKSHPTGRLALTRQNPKILYGQTIKGRYYITELLSEDASSFVYLADDKIIADKQVVFRVLLDEKNDEFLSKILAEERVSLSHINHPNVVGVLDSGELLEGNPFIVSEYVDGFSLEEKLQILDNFNPMRTARIIRQASYALSEVHQNGVLHRGLKPANIILSVSEAGTEQVKVTDFVVANSVNRHNFDSLKYISPEQLEGKLPNFASDIYSLAVIAFQMLTGRLPFSFSNAEQLLRAQRGGLKVGASNLKMELSPTVDEVLEKALAYTPSARYPKARDFGDALFNALTASSNGNKSTESEAFSLKKVDSESSQKSLNVSEVKEEKLPLKDNQIIFTAKNEKSEEVETLETVTPVTAESKINSPSNDELAWEKRSPDPIKIPSSALILISALGLLLLGLIVWGIWHTFQTRKAQSEFPEVSSTQKTEQSETPNLPIDSNKVVPNEEIESAPLPRNIAQPPNTEYFENVKSNLKNDLLKNYRGFALYYPKDWVKGNSDTNFVDVSKKDAKGLPIEQFLVTYYDSRGTFKLDKEKYPAQIKESVKKLSKDIPNFKLISEGDTVVNNGWKAYEMKFQGGGKAENGEDLTLWGRCLYIPAATQGVKSGFLITMLATSLSPDVKSADDVGIKGELGNILETFEPTPLN